MQVLTSIVSCHFLEELERKEEKVCARAKRTQNTLLLVKFSKGYANVNKKVKSCITQLSHFFVIFFEMEVLPFFPLSCCD